MILVVPELKVSSWIDAKVLGVVTELIVWWQIDNRVLATPL
jgi:hypothetical protein